MDEIQKKVLQQNTTTLVDHLILTEAFKNELHQAGIFPGPMLAEIMSEKTVQLRTSRMLELLPTRGPSAFEQFLQILGKDYSWLRREIQDSLDNEIGEENKSMSTPNVFDEVNDKSGISSLLHRLFGPRSKFYEKDNRTLEKRMTDALQKERTTWKTLLDSEKQSTAMLQEALENISSKIDIANLKLEDCLYLCEGKAKQKTVDKNLSLEDAVADLDHNINVVLEKLRFMAQDRKKCLEAVSLTLNVPTGNNALLPSPRFRSMSIYKHVTKMKEEYEQNLRKLKEGNTMEIRQLKDELDLLTAKNEDLAKRSQQHPFEALYRKKVTKTLIQRVELEKREQVIKEQDKKIATLQAHLSSSLSRKYDKPWSSLNSQTYKEFVQQLGAQVSQKPKAKALKELRSGICRRSLPTVRSIDRTVTLEPIDRKKLLKKPLYCYAYMHDNNKDINTN